MCIKSKLTIFEDNILPPGFARVERKLNYSRKHANCNSLICIAVCTKNSNMHTTLSGTKCEISLDDLNGMRPDLEGT